MANQFRNLVFEGGGVKGIAYIGAMQVLDHRGYLKKIDRVGGTSAGAINALIFALGYSIHQQKEILDSTDFNQFMDTSFGLIRDIRRLAKEYGWHKGDFLYDWVGKLIKNRLGKAEATFTDLIKAKCCDLYIIGTNLSTGYAEIFSHERYPDMPIVDAIRISMSIPLFFAAKHLGINNDLYVDGGVIANYPVKLFDRERYIDTKEINLAARTVEYYNKENAFFLLKSPNSSPYIYNRQTLGLRLDTAEEIALFRYNEKPIGKPINSFSVFAKALIGAYMQAQENQHLHSDDWQRTLYINTLDVKATDFDLSAEKKVQLIKEGINGAENYFQWFEHQNENPVNRIEKE